MGQIVVEASQGEVGRELFINGELEHSHGIGGIDDERELAVLESRKRREEAVISRFNIFGRE
jgi:hypothetical protein